MSSASSPPEHRDDRRALALLAVATLTVMSTVIIAPAIPDMAAAFERAPHAELYTKLILTMPALMIVLAAPVAGMIIDRHGRLPLLYGSMILYGLAGTAGFWLDDLGLILVSRALLGLAIAGTMTTMTTLASDYFAGDARTRFTGRQSIVMSFGAVVCVAAGGVLAETSWRLPFLIYLAGWLILPYVMRRLDEPVRAAASALRPPPLDGATMRRIALIYLTTFFAVAMFYVSSAQAPFLAREIGVQSTTLIGIALAGCSLLAAVSSSRYVALRARAGFPRIYAISFGAMALGYALVGFVPSFPALLVGLLVAGIGVGLFFPNGTLWAVTLAPPHARGRVSGGLTSSVFLGQFLSPILVEPVVKLTSLAGAFAVSAVLLAVVGFGYAAFGRPRATDDHAGSHAR